MDFKGCQTLVRFHMANRSLSTDSCSGIFFAQNVGDTVIHMFIVWGKNADMHFRFGETGRGVLVDSAL